MCWRDNAPSVMCHGWAVPGADPRVGTTLLCPAEAEAGKSRIFGSGLVSWNALQEAEGAYSKHSEFIKASRKHQHITPRTSGLENHPLSLKDTKCCFPHPCVVPRRAACSGYRLGQARFALCSSLMTPPNTKEIHFLLHFSK